MAARKNADPSRHRCRANARERDRTQSVNAAFSALRTLIPRQPTDRKLSKMETLKLASNYIEHLLTLLLMDVNDQSCLRLGDTAFMAGDRICDDASDGKVDGCAFCCIAQNRSSSESTLMVHRGFHNVESAYPIPSCDIS